MAKSKQNLRLRFWVDAALALLTGLSVVLTIVWHSWIEVLGFDPDRHNGSSEWSIVAAFFLLFLVFAVFARLEWCSAAPTIPNTRGPGASSA